MDFEKDDQQFSATINMCFVQRTPLREFRVLGENGSIFWDIAGNTITLSDYVHDNFQKYKFDSFNRNDMFRDQLIHFIGCIEKGSEPITNLNRTIGSHIIAMKIKEALQTNNFVSIT